MSRMPQQAVHSGLDRAYKALVRILKNAKSQFKRHGSITSGANVCRAIERFIDELYRIPNARSALKKRAEYVAEKCKPSSAYDNARAAALKTYHGNPREKTRSKLAIASLRRFKKPPTMLGEIDRVRENLEYVLGDRILRLSGLAVAKFDHWKNQCHRIQRTGRRREVDGCFYLYHVHRNADPSPPDISKEVHNMFQFGTLGGAVVDEILRAARVLMDWVKSQIRSKPRGASRKEAKRRSPSASKRKRTPKLHSNPVQDKHIANAWKTGAYKKYTDLARKLGKSRDEVKRAIDRHRKR